MESTVNRSGAIDFRAMRVRLLGPRIRSRVADKLPDPESCRSSVVHASTKMYLLVVSPRRCRSDLRPASASCGIRTGFDSIFEGMVESPQRSPAQRLQRVHRGCVSLTCNDRGTQQATETGAMNQHRRARRTAVENSTIPIDAQSEPNTRGAASDEVPPHHGTSFLHQ